MGPKDLGTMLIGTIGLWDYVTFVPRTFRPLDLVHFDFGIIDFQDPGTLGHWDF